MASFPTCCFLDSAPKLFKTRIKRNRRLPCMGCLGRLNCDPKTVGACRSFARRKETTLVKEDSWQMAIAKIKIHTTPNHVTRLRGYGHRIRKSFPACANSRANRDWRSGIRTGIDSHYGSSQMKICDIPRRFRNNSYCRRPREFDFGTAIA